MPTNYAAESEIRTACANAGVLSTAIDDFIIDFQNYKFTRDEVGAGGAVELPGNVWD